MKNAHRVRIATLKLIASEQESRKIRLSQLITAVGPQNIDMGFECESLAGAVDALEKADNSEKEIIKEKWVRPFSRSAVEKASTAGDLEKVYRFVLRDDREAAFEKWLGLCATSAEISALFGAVWDEQPRNGSAYMEKKSGRSERVVRKWNEITTQEAQAAITVTQAYEVYTNSPHEVVATGDPAELKVGIEAARQKWDELSLIEVDFAFNECIVLEGYENAPLDGAARQAALRKLAQLVEQRSQKRAIEL